MQVAHALTCRIGLNDAVTSMTLSRRKQRPIVSDGTKYYSQRTKIEHIINNDTVAAAHAVSALCVARQIIHLALRSCTRGLNKTTRINRLMGDAVVCILSFVTPNIQWSHVLFSTGLVPTTRRIADAGIIL